MHIDPAAVAATLGSPTQSFPAFVDPTVAQTPILNTQREESVMSPTTSQHSPWGTMHSSVNGGKEAMDASRSPSAKSAPLLSPVMETRTPLQNVARKMLPKGPPAIVNGNLATNGTQSNGIPPARKPEPVPPTPLTMPITNSWAYTAALNAPTSSSKMLPPQQRNTQPMSAISATNPGANQWQTTESKKKTARKRAKSGPSRSNNNGGLPSNPRGQPLPAKPEDRKGG
jgi:hypothetical protein